MFHGIKFTPLFVLFNIVCAFVKLNMLLVYPDDDDDGGDDGDNYAVAADDHNNTNPVNSFLLDSIPVVLLALVSYRRIQEALD